MMYLYLEEDIPYQLLKPNFKGFPAMAKIEQIFPAEYICDVEKAIHNEISHLSLQNIQGARIAITAGSRGIPNFAEIVRAIGKELRILGAIPFIVPAMGSHGNGDPIDQVAVLESYGITELNMDMQILSSMETVNLGLSDSGSEVFCDKIAYEADGIVVCGRVKPHTDFRGPIESGLCKMMTVGLGNHFGAISFHKTGSGDMSLRLQNAAKLFLAKTKVLFGVALIDNAYHQTKHIEVVVPENFLKREPELLIEAAKCMPKILIKDIDVLLVDWYGKEISGAGMDPNVTGRFLFAPHLTYPNHPNVKKIAVMRLTEASHGNAAGLGIADYISKKFAQKLDLGITYTNSLSSTLSLGKIPMIMNNDLDTIYAASSACGKADIKDIKIVRIKNTIELEHMWVSENYLGELISRKDIRIAEDPLPFAFDNSNNLLDL